VRLEANHINNEQPWEWRQKCVEDDEELVCLWVTGVERRCMIPWF
jgi:hypothetical protein